MIELDKDNLQELIQSNNKVAVQYGAGWCGNCRMVKPKFKKLSTEHQGIEFVYVDAEKFPDSRKLAKVDNLPTFAVFEGGKLVKQAQGNKIDTVTELLGSLSQ